MRRLSLTSLVLVLFLAIAALNAAASKTQPAAAQKIPAGITRVTAVEGITEYRLDNGLRFLLFPDRSKGTITVNITYLAGSRHEGYGETGMAHLIEHMIFKGSTKHPNIPQELTARGARPNGTTWFDRTNYFETVTAGDDNLAWALDLESDRMVHSFMKKSDLDSEMTVVRNEFEMGENDPRAVLTDRLLSAAYLWHNYGKSTIGSRSDLENVPIETLAAFYRKWYQPDNAVLVIAGQFDEAKALSLVAEKFGSIPRPARTIEKTYTVEPAQDGERALELRRVGDTQVAGALWHIPSGSHADAAPLEILAYLLGDEPSGHLFKALVDTKKAASVSASAWQLAEPGIFTVSADVRVGQSLDDARSVLIRVAEEAGSNPPEATELDRARQSIAKEWDLLFRNPEWASIQLSEWTAMGDWRLFFLHRDRVRNVTAADVQRVAKTYLRAENRTVGTFIPTKEPMRADIPRPPDIASLFKDWHAGAEIRQGEDLPADPAAIEARITRIKLPSGLKIILLPKKTRGEMFIANLGLRFGDEKSLRARGAAGDLAGDLLMRGTKTKTRQQIQDAIDKLTARVFVGGYPSGAYGSVEAPAANAEAALRLLAEILKEPSFPAEELDKLREEVLLQAEESKTDPMQMASTAWSRHLNPWPAEDPRHVDTPEEKIAAVQAVTLDQIRKFHTDFYGAESGELTIIGEFDPAKIKKLVGELFGNWKNRTPWKWLQNPYQVRPAATLKIEAPDKESAMAQAGMRIEMKEDDADYPAMVLGNFMTGGGFLNSRLAVRLRQKDGLSYGAGSFFYASPFEKDGTWGFYAIYAPQNADKLETGFREEIARLLESGFTPDEIKEAKAGWLDSRKVSRAQERELARTLGQREYAGRTLAWDAELEKKVLALTADQILASMKRHLDPKAISFIQAGDFAGAKKKKESGELPETRTGK